MQANRANRWQGVQMVPSVLNNMPNAIDALKPDEIFVFGSNLHGHHGGGAARGSKEKVWCCLGTGRRLARLKLCDTDHAGWCRDHQTIR